MSQNENIEGKKNHKKFFTWSTYVIVLGLVFSSAVQGAKKIIIHFNAEDEGENYTPHHITVKATAGFQIRGSSSEDYARSSVTTVTLIGHEARETDATGKEGTKFTFSFRNPTNSTQLEREQRGLKKESECLLKDSGDYRLERSHDLILSLEHPPSCFSFLGYRKSVQTKIKPPKLDVEELELWFKVERGKPKLCFEQPRSGTRIVPQGSPPLVPIHEGRAAQWEEQRIDRT